MAQDFQDLLSETQFCENVKQNSGGRILSSDLEGTDPEPSFRYPSEECPVVYVISMFSITCSQKSEYFEPLNICIYIFYEHLHFLSVNPCKHIIQSSGVFCFILLTSFPNTI